MLTNERIAELEKRPFFRANPNAVEKLKNGVCTFCSKGVGAFRDSLSLKEYGISGMCQACQDSLFGE